VVRSLFCRPHPLSRTPFEVWDLAPASASAGARLVAATPFKGGALPIEAQTVRGSCLDGAG
jgi:hypothetical protein